MQPSTFQSRSGATPPLKNGGGGGGNFPFSRGNLVVATQKRARVRGDSEEIRVIYI